MSRWHSTKQQMSRRTRLFCGCVWLVLTGCATPPEAFVPRFEAALATGQAEQVLPLITAASRPLVGALLAAGPAELRAQAMRTPLEVVDIRPDDAADAGMGFLLQVRPQGQPAGITRDWVILQEDGQWRLDLAATALRRPWGSAGTPNSTLVPSGIVLPAPDAP
jgi:hypothetical protein